MQKKNHKQTRTAPEMCSIFPSWDFTTAFNLDTWWWSLSLHCSLLLALPSYKSLHASGRFSPRSEIWKLNLSRWIKFAVSRGKGNQCCRKLSSSPAWYPLCRKTMWQQNWNRCLNMITVNGFASGKWQDLWREKPPEQLLAFWLLLVLHSGSQKEDTKQQQTGKDLEMTQRSFL